MPGLLGNGWNDPQSAAMMALAGGMVQGNFGGGLLGASNAYQESQNGLLKRQLTDAQLRNFDSEIEARKLKTIQDQRKQALLAGLFDPSGAGPSQPAEMGQLGSGSFGAVPPPQGMPAIPQAQPQQAGSGFMSRLNPEMLARLKIGADTDLTDIYKLTQPKWENVGGNMVNTNAPNFKGGFQPQVKLADNGQATYLDTGPDGLPRVSAPQGAVDTYRQFRQADAGVSAANKPLKVYNPATQREEFTTEAQVIQNAQPPSMQRPPAIGPRPNASEATMRTAVNGPMGADPVVLDRELQQTSQQIAFAKDPASRQMLQEHLADLQRQKAALPAGPMAAGQSVSEKLSSEAGGHLNQSWITKSYEPTLAAGSSARDLIDTVQVTRTAMTNLGKTGWGTQAQAAGAGILSGLGIAPQNAKLFAANAEVFQSKAMERLWTTLNAATGPQTEGDAQRATKTFASLANTPKANEFILDMAEAKATRDQMKAQFYQQAQPIARQKGDLSEVDREWAKRAPSIFVMPTMKRWGEGIK